MNHHQLIEIGLNYEGISLRYPFDPDLPVLFVHKKMFALLGKLQGVEMVNLKTSQMRHGYTARLILEP